MERSLVKESAAGHRAGVPGRFAALVRIHQVPEDTTNETAIPSEQTRCAYDDLLNRRRQAISNLRECTEFARHTLTTDSIMFVRIAPSIPCFAPEAATEHRAVAVSASRPVRHRSATVWSPRVRSCETRAVNLRWLMQLGPAVDGASFGCHPLAARSP